jgi:hypothetical protein
MVRAGRDSVTGNGCAETALQLGFVDEATFDRVVDPAKMVKPYVAMPEAERVRTEDRVATK